MYHFSPFTIELNEMEPGVAPTDSRFRPDMRVMEEGDLENADKIMHALEKKYIGKKRVEPVWFEKKTNSITNETFYQFKRSKSSQNYWMCKKKNDWRKAPVSLFNY